MEESSEIVWLIEERTFGTLIEMGAYFSLIKFNHKGMSYEIYVDNNEWQFYEGNSSGDD